MRVLIACESSERVKRAFLLRGHDAHSYDLKTGELGLPNHHIQDVLEVLDEGWDMLIGFPDCTYTGNSGARWMSRQGRLELLEKSAKFFNALLNAPIDKIALENPIHHKQARLLIRPYDQIIQPFHFGDKERKATCLWLKNLPPLMAKFSGGEGIQQSVWREPPSANRKTNRSRTPNGVATAMAEQWGGNP